MKKQRKKVGIAGLGILGAPVAYLAATECNEGGEPLFDVDVWEAAKGPFTGNSILPVHDHKGLGYPLHPETARSLARASMIFHECAPQYFFAPKPTETWVLTTQQTADSGRLTSERHFKEYNRVSIAEIEKTLNQIAALTGKSKEEVYDRHGFPTGSPCRRLSSKVLNDVYVHDMAYKIQGGFAAPEQSFDTLLMYASLIDALEKMPNVRIHYKHAIPPWEVGSTTGHLRTYVNPTRDGRRWEIETEYDRERIKFDVDYFTSLLNTGNMAVNIPEPGTEHYVSQRAMAVLDVSGLDPNGPAGTTAFLMLENDGKGGIYSPTPKTATGELHRAIVALPIQDAGSYLDPGGLPQILNADNPHVKPWQWAKGWTAERHREAMMTAIKERFPFTRDLADGDFDEIHYRHNIMAVPDISQRTSMDVIERAPGYLECTLPKATGAMEGAIQCIEMIKRRHKNRSINLQKAPDAMKVLFGQMRSSNSSSHYTRLRELPPGDAEKQANRSRLLSPELLLKGFPFDPDDPKHAHNRSQPMI